MREGQVRLVQRVVAGCGVVALALAALLSPWLGPDRPIPTMTLPFFGLALAVTTTAARPSLRPVGWLGGVLSLAGLVGLFRQDAWAPWVLGGAAAASAWVLLVLLTARGGSTAR